MGQLSHNLRKMQLLPFVQKTWKKIQIAQTEGENAWPFEM